MLAAVTECGWSSSRECYTTDDKPVLDAAADDRLIRENPCKAKTVRRPVGASPRVVV